MVTELMRIRREHKLTSGQLAEAAKLPLRVEYLCEIGGWVEEEIACRVVEALSRLTGTHYTLEAIALNIKDNEGDYLQKIPYMLTPPISRT